MFGQLSTCLSSTKVEVVNLVPKIVEKSKNVSFVDYSSSGGINCLSYFSCQKKEKKKKKGNRLQMSSSGSRWKCKSDLIYAYNTRRERNEKLACFHFSQICDVFLALYKPFFFFLVKFWNCHKLRLSTWDYFEWLLLFHRPEFLWPTNSIIFRYFLNIPMGFFEILIRKNTFAFWSWVVVC